MDDMFKDLYACMQEEKSVFNFLSDEDLRNLSAYFEIWNTQSDLERHIRTDNHRRLMALMDLLSRQPELRFNTVSNTSGMDVIEKILNTDGQR